MTLNKTLSSLLIAACATCALAAPSFAASRGAAVKGPKISQPAAPTRSQGRGEATGMKRGSHSEKRTGQVASKSSGHRKGRRTSRAKSRAKTTPVKNTTA